MSIPLVLVGLSGGAMSALGVLLARQGWRDHDAVDLVSGAVAAVLPWVAVAILIDGGLV